MSLYQGKYKGLYTALITPFVGNGKNSKVDWKNLEKIIRQQVQANVDGLVICGTTGESPTLTHEEHKEIIAKSIEITKELSDGKVQIIAGTGSNSTAETIDLTLSAQEQGADCALIISPYYNKPNQEQMIAHYAQVHNETNIDIILYNVPARTIVDISNDTVCKLARLDRIIGIKDATGDIQRATQLRKKLGNGFSLLSGNDETALAFNSQGGNGVISVISNLYPEEFKKLQDLSLNNKYSEALEIQLDIIDKIDAIGTEVNPVGIKYAMHLAGFCENEIRLPLTQPSEANAQIIRKVIKK